MKAKELKSMLPMNLQFFGSANDQTGNQTDPQQNNDPAPGNDPAADPQQNNDPAGNQTDPAADPQQQRTFTQEELNRVAARQAKEAREKVLRDLGLTEAQVKVLMQVNQGQQQTQQPAVDNSAQAVELLHARIKGELGVMRVKPDSADDMVLLAAAQINDVNNYDMDAVKAAVKAVKQRHVNSFEVTVSAQGNKNRGTGNNIGGSGFSQGNGSKAGKRGKELAEKKKKMLGLS